MWRHSLTDRNLHQSKSAFRPATSRGGALFVFPHRTWRGGRRFPPRARRAQTCWHEGRVVGGAGETCCVELTMAPQLFELTSARNVVFRGLVFETCRASAIRMKDCADCLGAFTFTCFCSCAANPVLVNYPLVRRDSSTVEHQNHNLLVEGSNPPLATMQWPPFARWLLFCGASL